MTLNLTPFFRGTCMRTMTQTTGSAKWICNDRNEKKFLGRSDWTYRKIGKQKYQVFSPKIELGVCLILEQLFPTIKREKTNEHSARSI